MKNIKKKHSANKIFGTWEMVKLGKLLNYQRPTKYIVESTNYEADGKVPVLTANKTFILGYTQEKNVFEKIPVIIFDDFTTDSKFVNFPFKIKSAAIKILTAREPEDNLYYIFMAMKEIPFEIGGHKCHWISEFQHLHIPYPPADVQARIANILQHYDEKIATMEDIIVNLEKTQTSLIYQLLGKTEERCRSGKHKGWKIKEVADIGVFSKGRGIAKGDILEQGIPAIRYADIYTTYNYDIREVKHFISEETAKTSKKIKFNDLLLAGSGETPTEVGKSVSFRLKDDAYACSDTIILSLPDECRADYLSYYLNTIARKMINRLAQGHSVVHIYASFLKTIEVPIPPLQEQERIVNIIDIWTQKIEIAEKMLTNYRQQQKSLLQQFFSGK